LKKLALLTLLAASSAMAAGETASATLTVTGTVSGALSITIDSAPGTFSGGGTNAATSDLGVFTQFAPPAGFTPTSTGPSSFSLTGAIGITVSATNVVSANYDLTAILGNPAETGLTYHLGAGAVVVTNAAPVTVAAAHAYGAFSLPWVLDVNSTNSIAINNSINLVATAN
jgi:hypothetical protein